MAFVTVEPRGRIPVWIRVALPLTSLAVAAAVGAILLVAIGQSPVAAYRAVLNSAFGSSVGLVGTLITATPLILTSLAVALAFRMKVWNIGGEGQLLLGAVAASGVALALGQSIPRVVAIAALLLAGALGGACWAAFAGVPRALFGTDEVISTLMLNFIAVYFVNYLIFDSRSYWRDTGGAGFPTGRYIPTSSQLPLVWHRLTVGFVLAVAASLLVWWLLRSTRWGYSIRVIGDSPDAGRYAGMNVKRMVLSVFLVSGATAGLAGGILVGGSTYGLQPGSLAVGLGYTGIVVAAVSRLNPLAIVPVAILVAGLTKAATSLQVLGVPSQIATLLQGLALLFVVAAEFFVNNRVRLSPRSEAALESHE
jgi:general nucleoside transport system permease protein